MADLHYFGKSPVCTEVWKSDRPRSYTTSEVSFHPAAGSPYLYLFQQPCTTSLRRSVVPRPQMSNHASEPPFAELATPPPRLTLEMAGKATKQLSRLFGLVVGLIYVLSISAARSGLLLPHPSELAILPPFRCSNRW